jgi:integrase
VASAMSGCRAHGLPAAVSATSSKRKQGPQAAHAVLKLLRKIMNWHATRADDFHSPIVKGMVKVNNEARERILTDDEIRAIWRATENGVEGAFVRFLLLTGARRTEAAKAEWTEIADGAARAALDSGRARSTPVLLREAGRVQTPRATDRAVILRRRTNVSAK